MISEKMRVSFAIALVLVFRAAADECGVYDDDGSPVANGHVMGTASRDVRAGTVLPGFLSLKNVAASLESANCSAISSDNSPGTLTFKTVDEFEKFGEASTVCELRLKLDGCLAREVYVYYVINDYDLHAPVFEKNDYGFKSTFPLAEGTVLCDEITVTDPDFSTRTIDLSFEQAVDGLEIIRIGPRTGKTSRFELKTSKVFYLDGDLNLTLIASVEPGELSSKARLKLQMNEDSGIPRPEFEKSFYDVTVNASDLAPDGLLFPTNAIRFKADYENVSLSLRSLNSNDLRLGAVREDGARNVNIRLLHVPETNLSSQDVLLHLSARKPGASDEGLTTLLIRLIADPACPVIEVPIIFESDNVEHLKTAVIVLSVVVVVLLFIILFGYFKYVCVRKKKQTEEVVQCKKCSAPPTKTRRPTPRKISEYPYPLDKMPAPLETLAETDVEEEGEGKGGGETKVAASKKENEGSSSPKAAKARKRSMTFIESDEESRHNRESIEAEVVVHENERKASVDSQRKASTDGEERRRRKSSTKMYRCMT